MSRPNPDPQHRCPPPPGQGVKPLRFVKGAWTSGGHAFNDHLICTRCRKTWKTQQSRPSYCAKAA